MALVHRSRVIAGNDGVPVFTKPWGGVRPEPGQVLTLSGDVTKPALGLDRATAACLAAEVDLMVHCAAVTGFNLDPAVYARVNVNGVAQALGFAAERRTPFLHVSTAYVCGERNGPIAESPAAGGRFANGYEASKAQGEALVLAAGRAGLPVVIARPSIIAGASSDGVIGEFTNLYQLIRLVAEGRVRRLPASADASLDLVPIDHVAALADIAERMAVAIGRIFHLASGAPVPVAALLPVLRGYPHLHAPQFVSPADLDTSRLKSREQLLTQQVTGVFAGYLQRNPRFETANLRELSGRVCPPTAAPYLRRLLGYAMKIGYLPASAAKGQLTTG